MRNHLRVYTAEALMELFDPAVHEAIGRLLAKKGVVGLVLFENKDLGSRHLGERSALAIGPSCRYKGLEEVWDQHLGELPSQWKYPVGICFTRQILPGHYRGMERSTFRWGTLCRGCVAALGYTGSHEAYLWPPEGADKPQPACMMCGGEVKID